VEWLESEAPVVDEGEGYAGTLDAIAIIKSLSDVPFVIDFKSAKSIYSEYWMQVAAYEQARRKMEGEYEFTVERDDEEPYTIRRKYAKAGQMNVGILRLDKETGMPEFEAYTRDSFIKQKKGSCEYEIEPLDEKYIERQMAAFQMILNFYYLQKNRRGLYTTAKTKGNKHADMVRALYAIEKEAPAKKRGRPRKAK
jgi:hypothetical protein